MFLPPPAEVLQGDYPVSGTRHPPREDLRDLRDPRGRMASARGDSRQERVPGRPTSVTRSWGLSCTSRNLFGRAWPTPGLVKVQSRHPKTFMLKMLHAAIKNQFIPDDDIRTHIGRHFSDTWAVSARVDGNRSGDGVPAEEMKGEGMEESVRDLLLDVLHHPYCGMVDRYKRLKTSRRKGHNLKDTALRGGLAEQVRVPTRSGIVVLLDLTAKGRALLADETGIVEIPPRRGGLVHEYWKHRIAAELRATGLKVEVEAPLKTGGTVDILVHTKDGPRAIEIETGKSDAKANVEKCQRAGVPVTLVATEREVEKRLKEVLPTNTSIFSVIDPIQPLWELGEL